MNLTPTQILTRNLFASIAGIDDVAVIEMAFQNPNLETTILETFGPAFNGPFGSLAIGENCPCQGVDGYRQALVDVEATYGIDVSTLRNDFEAAVTPPALEPEAGTNNVGVDALAALLSSLFGREISVVTI